MTDIEDIINRRSLDDISDNKIKDFVLDLIKDEFNTQKEFQKIIRKLSRKHKLMPSKPAHNEVCIRRNIKFWKKFYNKEISKRL